MRAGYVCLAGLAVFYLGYRFYSRFLARTVFELRDDEPTPAHTQADGVDYVATHKHVLLGHHYASIAGAAPIIGPAIAVVWGWLPAVIWIVVGTVFMGAVHDMSTLVLSVRHGGESVGKITEKIIGPRARTLFLLIIFFLIFLVIAVFADAISGLFIAQPGTVIPINFEILVAVGIGWACTKKGVKLFWPSIAALIAMYAMVWVGVEVPVSLEGLFGAHQKTAWVVLLLGYGFVASVLPVWVLLQPRDFINSHQLVVGLAALIGGLLIANPVIQAPAVRFDVADGPFWFPFLFVTIACGAISGFHGLVASGTTSKQLDRAPDARLIGYGAMLGEGVLALIATLAVSAGLADWAGHYHGFAAAKGGGVGAFVNGSATFLEAWGLPSHPAKVIVSVLVVSFAATSLDTGVRIQRFILEELGRVYRVSWLQNRVVAAAIAVGLPLLVYLAGQQRFLWPLFGGGNQLLAGVSLLVVTFWLWRQGKAWWVTGVPMVIVLIVSALALVSLVGVFLGTGQYVLAAVGALMVALEFWIFFEGFAAWRRVRAEQDT